MVFDDNKIIEEAITAERQNLEFDANEDNLIAAIDNAVEESRDLKELVDTIGHSNQLYWEKGTDMDLDKMIHPRRSKVVDNRIFMGVETLIPMITASTPDPEIVSEIDNTLREKILMALKIFYEVKGKIKKKLQTVVRHWFIYRIGIWKYRWDNGFILEPVRPIKVGFDPRATSLENCEYIWEDLEDTIGNLISKYPAKKKDLEEKYGKDRLKTKVVYKEFWGGNGEWVVWKLGNIILDKIKNPNFDYGSKEKGMEGEEGYVPAQEATDNIFKSPKFPYLILRVFDLGETVYDDTGLIEQVKLLQEGVSKRKRQIADLCDDVKRIIIASSRALTKKQAQAFVNKYGQKLLFLDKGEINDVRVEGGVVDNAMILDMNHSIAEIDNIFGTHSTTRGERQEQETLGGRRLLTASDFGRSEGIVENVEQLLEDLYQAYLHMFKVYETEAVRFSNGEISGELHPDEIPNDILIMIKKGSTLPVDKVSRAQMAGDLAKAGMIDPLTLFEELGYGNAQDRVQDLFKWLAQTGKIQPQVAGMEGGGDQRLVQIEDFLASPQFKELPIEKQQEIIKRTRNIVNNLKGGMQPPTR